MWIFLEVCVREEVRHRDAPALKNYIGHNVCEYQEDVKEKWGDIKETGVGSTIKNNVEVRTSK